MVQNELSFIKKTQEQEQNDIRAIKNIAAIE